MMKIKILNEAGYEEALLGLGLSYGITSESEYITSVIFPKMKEISGKLATKDDGHNKFLESIQVWLDITAPRYFWSQFDTYRIGITKQSESTMHTLLKYPLTQEMFESPVPCLQFLEDTRQRMNLPMLKNCLPEGFLQRRIISTNYKVLRHIIQQRETHRLEQWKVLCAYLKVNLKYYVSLFGEQ